MTTAQELLAIRRSLQAAREGIRAVSVAYLGTGVAVTSSRAVVEGFGQAVVLVLGGLFVVVGLVYWFVWPTLPDVPLVRRRGRQSTVGLAEGVAADSVTIVAWSTIVAMWGVVVAAIAVTTDLLSTLPYGTVLSAILGVAFVVVGLAVTRSEVTGGRKARRNFPLNPVGPLVFGRSWVVLDAVVARALHRMIDIMRTEIGSIETGLTRQLEVVMVRRNDPEPALQKAAELYARLAGVVYAGQDVRLSMRVSPPFEALASFRVPVFLVPLVIIIYLPFLTLFSYLEVRRQLGFFQRVFEQLRAEPLQQSWIPDLPPIALMVSTVERSRSPTGPIRRLRRILAHWMRPPETGAGPLENPRHVLRQLEKWSVEYERRRALLAEV